MYISRPILRSDDAVKREGSCLVVTYLNEGYRIEFDDPELISGTEALLARLNGANTIDELVAAVSELSPEQISGTLSMLDSNFLLGEGSDQVGSMSGMAFALHLEDLYYNHWMGQDGETDLVRTVFDGTASRDVLIGWCIECFHVTTRAHDCLAPIISRMHGAQKSVAISYVIDEYRHDKLLMKSLLALDYTREQVEQSLPLPFTNAVMNLLARWSNTDLLSFMGCLFVFEGTNEIGDAYIHQLKKYDLPKDFLHGQFAHNEVNNAGEHGAISRMFYGQLPSIGPDDQARVVRGLRTLYEAQRQKHTNVLGYYTNPVIGIPRTLHR